MWATTVIPGLGYGSVADITELLKRWSAGDAKAFDDLAPLIYRELKSLSQRVLLNERYAPTLNCTALVHEAYLRLVGQTRMEWSGRAHFFGAAAQIMRRILVDHARQRLASKRGAGATHEALDKAVAVSLEPDLDVIAVHEALEELTVEDPESARVVELRFFGGLSIEETAEILETSPSSITRIWSFARAWLYRRLNPSA
jgi:RNA polymerase sigma factor (TIGR02999 family)